MIREALHAQGPLPQKTSEALRTHASQFVRGVLLALASPSAILWFAAVGGSVIAATASGPDALLPFMAGFASAGVLWAVGVALLVGRARHAMGARAIRAIALLSAALFVYLAVRVFVHGYREFVA
jgi:L-lysine exporter family protein LysE/ArgO